jgi:hypothetical protein
VRSAQVLAVRALMLGVLLASAGCFRPKIPSGAYACGDGDACPDGLQCDHPRNLCVSSIGGAPGTGGAGGMGGKGGAGNVDGGPIDRPVDRPCTGAIASCQPADAATGMCDPVCNRGCSACYQKCSVNTTGALTCNELYPPGQQPAGLLQFCGPYSPSDPNGQSDNCGPGQICMNGSACGVPRCYQFCRGNSDCTGGASCSRDGGSYQFCDVPPKACDPVAGGTGSQDCGGLNCYLSQTGQNTLCDCQFGRAGLTGVGRPGDPCDHSRDCISGAVCVFLSPSLGKQCKAVCRLPVDGGPQDLCPGGCQLLQAAGGSVYGWCNN